MRDTLEKFSRTSFPRVRMASNAVTLRPALTSEVRKLKSRHVAALGRILSGQEDWKTLMGSVRAEPENPDSPFKFTAEDVRYARMLPIK